MKWFALGVTLFLAAVVSSQRHALACELLPVLSKRTIAEDVFVADDIPVEQFDGLRNLVSSAVERIARVYGMPESSPRYFISSDSQVAAKWGANATGAMHRMPWRSCIVIGPKGQNIDVLSHESLHAEIQQRVGFWRFLREVPVWFDEGAALTLDYREPYLPENIMLSDAEVKAARHLEKGRDFFAGDIKKHYQAARVAVEPLIRPEYFFADLDRVRNGEAFDAVFVDADDD